MSFNNNPYGGTGGVVDLNDAILTGVPVAPTAAAATNTTQIATTAFVRTEVANLVASAPGTLDTLDELAAALGDDASFSTTVTNSIAAKLPLAGGTMAGAIQYTEITLTPTGTTQTLTLSAGNRQTLALTSATGTVTLTIAVPAGSADCSVIIAQHASAVKDLVIASAATIVWIGAEPDWAADTTSSKRLLVCRYNSSILYLQASEISGGTTFTQKRVFGVVFDGGGAAPTVNTKRYWRCPWTGTITKATLLAEVSGSAVIDVWKDTYANYPPVVGDTITASAKPTLSSAIKSENSTLTGWTLSVTAGDVFGFNLDSVTTCTVLTLEIEMNEVI